MGQNEQGELGDGVGGQRHLFQCYLSQNSYLGEDLSEVYLILFGGNECMNAGAK